MEHKSEAIKVFLLAIAVLTFTFLQGCGPGPITSGARPCTVVEEGDSATITCPDGTTATITDGSDGTNGTDGSDGDSGEDGTDGTNGHSAAFSQRLADSAECPKGGIVISAGIDLNDNAALDSNEVTQTLVICKDKKGKGKGKNK
jgi:hypothetical protein